MKKKTFYIWSGVFKNFKDANKLKVGKGFKGKIWKKEQTKIFNLCKDFSLAQKPIPKLYKERNMGLISILKKIFKREKKIKILDYGGGFGIAYYVLKEKFKDDIKFFIYTILEIPNVCKFGKKLSPNIKFTTKANTKINYDLLYSSSALQYFNNWQKIIVKFTKLKPKFIFLADTFAGDIPSYVSLQNYYDSKIPHWFININELNKLFLNNEYKLVSKNTTFATRLKFKTTIPMQNFKKKYVLKNTLNLLYEKIR